MIVTALIINGVLLACCAACWAWELFLRQQSQPHMRKQLQRARQQNAELVEQVRRWQARADNRDGIASTDKDLEIERLQKTLAKKDMLINQKWSELHGKN